MNNYIKVFSLISVLAASFSVNAAQRDITVTANIDPTIDVTLADGSPLPSSIEMQYLPGKGLAAHKENIKFWSNTADRALNVSLANAPSLTDANGQNTIPLSVSVNGNTLSTTAVSLNYATTFPSGIANGSSTMPLVISQTTPGDVSASGNYTGIVSLVVTQATSSAGN
ncbi:TPA: CS1 type fimbrial major subunit [Serratia marcescens]